MCLFDKKITKNQQKNAAALMHQNPFKAKIERTL